MSFQPEKNNNSESKDDLEGKSKKEELLPYKAKKSLSIGVVLGLLLLCLAVGILVAF